MKNSISTTLSHFVVIISLFICPSALSEGIGMVTGSSTGTYFKFGHEIAENAKIANLELVVKESEGSIDNIKRINSKENAAFAIVQTDVLGFLKRSNDPELNQIADRLRLIFPFYNEEVHLFARKEIKQLKDLQGKKVVVGTQGSGTWLTATNMLGIEEVIPSESLDLPAADAVIAVLMGEVDAMFYVAGKPVKLFSNLSHLEADTASLLDDVHFVPLNNAQIQSEYVDSQIGPAEYSWMDHAVPTAAVKAALVSFDFSSKKTPYYKKRCQQLGSLGQVIRDNLSTLQAQGHPKWREVALEDNVGIWQLDNCSRAQQKLISKTDIQALLKQKLTQ